MGIFSQIRDAIFGHAAAAPAPQPAPEPVVATGGGVAAAAATAEAPAPAQVNVEQVLEERARNAGQTLNWRSSIVDLMKLLGIDSSLANREALARELGYTGALNGSAEMNTALHQATMRELARNGGIVPASMLD